MADTATTAPPTLVATACLTEGPWRFACPAPSCALPSDCDACDRYTCSKCGKVRPWSMGAADDNFEWCDECVFGIPEEQP